MPRITLKKFASFLFLVLGMILFIDIISYNRQFLEKNVHFKEIFALSNLSPKIDWMDQHLIEESKPREGPGEHGQGVYLENVDEKQVMQLINVNGFNALVSDHIALNRSINDLRTNACKSLKYDRILPSTSIIIPFHDEHWSTLLRTVHSIISRSPSSLVLEVILVDDNSTKPFLGEDLDKYISANFSVVRILRTHKREGLIRARIIGAKSASAEILIFLDSHCEVGINWLPPLIQPIKDNYKTVTCPFIDVINNDNFALHPQDEGARGSFDWKMDYKRLPRLKEDYDHPEKPFDSPIMAGGLFAISKQWFWELSGYDPELEVWGGEQYELSFKIWMCGGKMVDIPCCRIGHIYRKFNPFGVRGLGDYVAKNYKRIAEVWMDEWKKFVYLKDPNRYNSIGFVNVNEQKKLRERLKCKTFQWFLENVAFDLLQRYPAEEPKPVSQGQIISLADPMLCIDTKFGKQNDPVLIAKCISNKKNDENGEQNFYFTWKFEIVPYGRHFCFDYPGEGRTVILYQCHKTGGNQRWIFNPNTQQIIHFITNKCIDSKPQRLELFINDCNSDTTQKWKLENVNAEVVQKEWKLNGVNFL